MPIFIPFEFPMSNDGQYTALLSNNRILYNRRNRLGLTQQDIAEMASIPLRQYQCLENGDIELCDASMSAGLTVCAILLLDPYELIGEPKKLPDPLSLRPQVTFDSGLPDDFDLPKRHGRKPIRRDILTVYFNHPHYSIIIPREVLEELGRPNFIRMFYLKAEKRFAFAPVNEDNGNDYDVPKLLFDEKANCEGLVFPSCPLVDDAKKELGWDDELYAVEARIVKSKDFDKLLLCDMCTEQPSQKFKGGFAIPSCIDNGEDD